MDNSLLRKLAQRVRRKHPRERNVPRLLELMADTNVADFRTIADVVHGACVDDNAILKAIKSARKEIVGARIPIRLVVSRRTLLKRRVPS
jgi:hypothetical protein